MAARRHRRAVHREDLRVGQLAGDAGRVDDVDAQRDDVACARCGGAGGRRGVTARIRVGTAGRNRRACAAGWRRAGRGGGGEDALMRSGRRSLRPGTAGVADLHLEKAGTGRGHAERACVKRGSHARRCTAAMRGCAGSVAHARCKRKSSARTGRRHERRREAAAWADAPRGVGAGARERAHDGDTAVPVLRRRREPARG